MYETSQQPNRFSLTRLLDDVQSIYTRPNAITMQLTRRTASWLGVLVTLGLYIVGEALIQGAGLALVSHGVVNATSFSSLLFPVVWGTVLLVVGVVCFTLAAMLFRGQSSVTTYVYTIAIIFATAFFVGDLFRLIPLLGPTLAEILAIYSVYLAGVATSALQRLALGPTIAVVVIALILWAAFFFGVESSGVLLHLTFQIGSLKLNV